MWVVELRFTDDTQRLAARPAHRRVLEGLHRDGQIVMAGPLADDSGALLVFDVATRDQLQRLLDDDPYYAIPGVELRDAREWAPIFP